MKKVKLETLYRRGQFAHLGPLPLHIFKMKISGEFHYFIIDTGSEGTMLSMEMVAIAFGGVPPSKAIRGTIGLNGINGVKPAPLVSMKFNLLGVTVGEVASTSNMFDDMSHQTGVRISGLLGQDFLRKFKSYTIDNVRQEITFNV